MNVQNVKRLRGSEVMNVKNVMKVRNVKRFGSYENHYNGFL